MTANRTIIIGDVHGCLTELRELLALVAPTADDSVVFVGDLVDKGPDSPGVVREVRELREGGVPVVLVLGNHEEKHARVRRRIGSGEDVSVVKGGDDIARITAALSPADVAFLETAVVSHAVPEHDAVVVHAGVLPTTRAVPTEASLAGASRKERDSALRVLRVRFVTPEGVFVTLGNEGPADKYWASVYDGRFGHVYFGHEPFHANVDASRFRHATGTDHGCVFGGWLTAVVLTAGAEPTEVSVRAHERYATHLGE